MTEEQFRQRIRATAKYYGWALQYHTHNSRRSDPGWPDEVFANPARSRVIFVEIKTDTGRVTQHQQAWLAMLTDAGFEVALWRPKDWDRILQVLGPQQVRLNDLGAETNNQLV